MGENFIISGPSDSVVFFLKEDAKHQMMNDEEKEEWIKWMTADVNVKLIYLENNMYLVMSDLTAELSLCPQDRHQVSGRGHHLRPHLDIQEPRRGQGSV